MEELVDAIKKRINDKVDIAQELSTLAVNRYSKENMVNGYLNIYNRLLNIGELNENKI